MEYERTPIEGLLIIYPDVFQDSRGFFFESYNEVKFKDIDISDVFIQDNHSKSYKNTLRGLHYQSHPGQAKLVRVSKGVVFDVAVDIRPNSPTCGEWFGTELSEENKIQFYIPIGFAHGFCVLSEEADYLYKCSNVYNAETECTIAWDDPDIGVEWPVSDPILSQRDKTGMSFRNYTESFK